MVDHERGAYTPPTDGPLTFDARQPVRGARPAPLTLILSILVLGGLVAAIFFFYRQGARQAGDAPQVVGEAVDGLRGPAPAEAQPQDPAAGLQIYKSDEAQPLETVTQPPKFVPPPEQPAARTPPPNVVVTPPAAPVTQAPAPTIRPTLPAEPPAAKAPAPIAKVAPPPAKAAPAPTAKLAAAKVEAKPDPKVEPKPAPVKAATGSASVQVGAVGSTELADKAWSSAIAAGGGLGAGKGKGIEKIERNGATLYRTAVTGFASKADAQAFCAKLKSAGKDCIVR